MAYRGRGRGRGRGFGGGFGRPGATPLAFELFPDNPALGKASEVKENRSMAVWYSKFEKFCKSSAYYIEDANECVKKKRGTKTEKLSTRDSEKNKPKARLADFINMVPDYVPAELATGNKKEKYGIKRVRWNAGSDMQLEEIFAKKLQELQREKANEANEKKEEQEEDDDVIDEEEESSDNGDYETNIDFDDDEDDFNMADDNDDEPIM